MIGYTPIDPNARGVTSSYDPGWGDTISAAFSAGRTGSIQSTLGDFMDDMDANAAGSRGEMGPLLPAEELSAKYAYPGLSFTKPEYDGIASRRYQRHSAAMEAQTVLGQMENKHLFWNFELPTSIKSGAALAATILGSLTKPGDLIVSMAPFVGSAAKAALVAEQLAIKGVASSALRSRIAVAFAKGLIPAEALPMGGSKAAHWVYSNVAAASVMQLPFALKEFQDKGEIDISDNLKAITSNTAFAASVHAAMSAMARLGEHTLSRLEGKAMSDMVDGKKVDVTDILRTDPSVVKEDVKADLISKTEAVVRAEATTIEKIKNLFEKSKVELEAAIKEREVSLLTEGRGPQFTPKEARAMAEAQVKQELSDIYVQAEARARTVGNIGTVTPDSAYAVAVEYVRQDREQLTDRQKIRFDAIKEVFSQVQDSKPTDSQSIRLGKLLGLDVDWKGGNAAAQDLNPTRGRVFLSGKKGLALVHTALDFDRRKAADIVKETQAFDSLVETEAKAELARRVDERLKKLSVLTDEVLERTRAGQEAADLRVADAAHNTHELGYLYQEALDRGQGKQWNAPKSLLETNTYLKDLESQVKKELVELKAHEQALLDATEKQFLAQDVAEAVTSSTIDCLLQHG